MRSTLSSEISSRKIVRLSPKYSAFFQSDIMGFLSRLRIYDENTPLWVGYIGGFLEATPRRGAIWSGGDVEGEEARHPARVGRGSPARDIYRVTASCPPPRGGRGVSHAPCRMVPVPS